MSRERAVLFGASGSLVGVVTPAGAAAPREPVAVILLNAGVVHRVGPNRLYVNLARRLAAAGHGTLRFDHSGIGDSRPREDALPFEESSVVEAVEAMDLMEAEEGCRRFVLVALCSGTLTAFRTACRDERVVGAVLLTALLEDPASVHEATINEAHDRKVARSYLTRKLFNRRSWAKFLSGRADYGRIARITGAAALERLRPRPGVSQGAGDVVARLDELTRRGVSLHFVYGEGTVVLEYFRMTLAAGIRKLARADNIDVTVLKGSDHTFSGVAQQARLVDLITRWVDAACATTARSAAGAAGRRHAT